MLRSMSEPGQPAGPNVGPNVGKDYWRKCTSCKSPILFNAKYWVCSVSTCNRQRTGLVFCKISCFDAHVPVMNHKDAGAIEKRSPSLKEFEREQDAQVARAANAAANAAASAERQTAMSTPPTPTGNVKRDEILVVVSKTKDYVRATTGLSTSESVMEVLSNKIRSLLDDATKRAIQDGRKTLMDRDF